MSCNMTCVTTQTTTLVRHNYLTMRGAARSLKLERFFVHEQPLLNDLLDGIGPHDAVLRYHQQRWSKGGRIKVYVADPNMRRTEVGTPSLRDLPLILMTSSPGIWVGLLRLWAAMHRKLVAPTQLWQQLGPHMLVPSMVSSSSYMYTQAAQAPSTSHQPGGPRLILCRLQQHKQARQLLRQRLL